MEWIKTENGYKSICGNYDIVRVPGRHFNLMVAGVRVNAAVTTLAACKQQAEHTDNERRDMTLPVDNVGAKGAGWPEGDYDCDPRDGSGVHDENPQTEPDDQPETYGENFRDANPAVANPHFMPGEKLVDIDFAGYSDEVSDFWLGVQYGVMPGAEQRTKKKKLLLVPTEETKHEPTGESDNVLTWLPPTADAWPTAKTHRWETECGRYRVTRLESIVRGSKEPPGYYGVEHRKAKLDQFAVMPDPKEPGSTYAKRFRGLRGALEAAERLHRGLTNLPRLQSNLEAIVMQAEKDGLDGFENMPEEPTAPAIDNVLTRSLMKNEALASARLDGETQVVGPTEEQVKEAREKHPGMVLLFRVGNDYQITGEDRKTVGGVLECGCLVGFESGELEGNLRKLLVAGHRVAICEQFSENNQENACPTASVGYNKVGDDEDIFTPEGQTMTETAEALDVRADANEKADADPQEAPKAEAKPLRVSPGEVVAMFREAGWHTAKVTKEKWQGRQLIERIGKMLDMPPKTWETVTSPAGKELLDQLLAAVTAGQKIELIDDETEDEMTATAEAPAKPRGRPKGSKNTGTNGKGEPKAPRSSGKQNRGDREKLDRFGSPVGSSNAMVNSVLTKKPKTVAEIVNETGLKPSQVRYAHLDKLARKKLIKKGDDGWYTL